MSDAPLMVTLSGIRGIAGVSLTKEVITKYVRAFCTTQLHEHPDNRLFILGRDSRISGEWVEAIASAAMQACGCQVLTCGIVPTPTVQVMVQEHHAAGGVIATSSHNPKEWNGLKFVDHDGLFIVPDKCTRVFALADAGSFVDGVGSIEHLPTAIDEHLAKILAVPDIDPELIRSQNYRVVVDSVCGAGGPILAKLMNHLGVEVISMNYETTGDFPHVPEPLPENLVDLCAAVKERNADLGIAVDPDVDRCVLIDGNGNPIGEEYTLVSAVYYALKWAGKRGVVCKNMSSSRATEDVAKMFGCRCINTPVGEIQVGLEMVRSNAVIGGEGNGGVMLPDVHIGRDAMVASALTLMLMAREHKTLREIVNALPRYSIHKTKFSTTQVNGDAALAAVKRALTGVEMDERDGLYIAASDYWVHLRKSNTEPIVRIIAEAHTPERAKQEADSIVRLVLPQESIH